MDFEQSSGAALATKSLVCHPRRGQRCDGGHHHPENATWSLHSFNKYLLNLARNQLSSPTFWETTVNKPVGAQGQLDLDRKETTKRLHVWNWSKMRERAQNMSIRLADIGERKKTIIVCESPE